MSAPASPRTWVLPNRNTIGLAAVLLGMWYAGLTQSNGAAYLLCFVLAGVSLVSMVHAWANGRGVRVEAQVLRAVFAGEEMTVEVRVAGGRRRGHEGMRLFLGEGGAKVSFPRVPAEGAVDGRVLVAAGVRGVFAVLPVRVESSYPLGFFTARTAFAVPAPHYVYPAPQGERPLPITPTPAPAPTRAVNGGVRREGDDFAGVRAWRVGESQRHIDWKAVARGQPLAVKEWAGDAETTVTLDWATLAGLPGEARLSQLVRWIVQAERGGVLYALRLPGANVPAARGEAHFHGCLRRLAAFSEEKAEAPAGGRA